MRLIALLLTLLLATPAFAVLPHFHGIGFSVGGIVPGASFNFDGPKDVRRWLEQLSADAKAKVS